MTLGENLRFLRKRKNLTQKELAELSGVSCNSIINYENGRRTDPPVSILMKIANALEVTLDDILPGKGGKTMSENIRTRFHNLLHALRKHAKKAGFAVKCKTRYMEDGGYKFEIILTPINQGASMESADSRRI